MSFPGRPRVEPEGKTVYDWTQGKEKLVRLVTHAEVVGNSDELPVSAFVVGMAIDRGAVLNDGTVCDELTGQTLEFIGSVLVPGTRVKKWTHIGGPTWASILWLLGLVPRPLDDEVDGVEALRSWDPFPDHKLPGLFAAEFMQWDAFEMGSLRQCYLLAVVACLVRSPDKPKINAWAMQWLLVAVLQVPDAMLPVVQRILAEVDGSRLLATCWAGGMFREVVMRHLDLATGDVVVNRSLERFNTVFRFLTVHCRSLVFYFETVECFHRYLPIAQIALDSKVKAVKGADTLQHLRATVELGSAEFKRTKNKNFVPKTVIKVSEDEVIITFRSWSREKRYPIARIENNPILMHLLAKSESINLL